LLPEAGITVPTTIPLHIEGDANGAPNRNPSGICHKLSAICTPDSSRRWSVHILLRKLRQALPKRLSKWDAFTVGLRSARNDYESV